MPYITFNRRLAGFVGLTFGILMALQGRLWIPLGLAGAAFGCYLVVTSYRDNGQQE